jgi:DNA polymerase III delta prime subunit
MRSDPKSADVIRRAVTGLSRRPRALESLLWRRLASTPWNESAEATEAALEAWQALYEGPLRNAIRAKAFANARATLG